MRKKFVWTAVALIMCLTAGMSAQFRGAGRITGTVRDDNGTPIAGVAISATMNGSRNEIGASSDEKGLWAVYGMGKGEWHVEFHKAGYRPTAARVNLESELARIPPIAINLKKGE